MHAQGQSSLSSLVGLLIIAHLCELMFIHSYSRIIDAHTIKNITHLLSKYRNTFYVHKYSKFAR